MSPVIYRNAFIELVIVGLDTNINKVVILFFVSRIQRWAPKVEFAYTNRDLETMPAIQAAIKRRVVSSSVYESFANNNNRENERSWINGTVNRTDADIYTRPDRR